jgi:nucleoside-diphosphate-sugar epimerase
MSSPSLEVTMRVFVTGASGWIGTAVVAELQSAGHQVVGLARSDASASALQSADVEVVRGSLDDLDTLRDTAAGADGVIHLAFRHDLIYTGDFPGAIAADRAAIGALGAALADSGKPLLIASGTGALGGDGVATEDTQPGGGEHAAAGRMDNERALLELPGVRPVSVRLPPTVHGTGDPGFIALIVAAARESGEASYVGDGSNAWAAVHRSDAARVFRLALEQAPAATVLHAVGEEGVPFRVIAEAIGRGLDLPVTALDPADAPARFGFLGGFAGTDMRASSAQTQARLGWTPTGPTLLEDLDAGAYFAAQPSAT